MSGVNINFAPVEPVPTRGRNTSLGENIGAGFTSAFQQGFVRDEARRNEAYGSYMDPIQRSVQGYLEFPSDIMRDVVDQGFNPDTATLERIRTWVEAEGSAYGYDIADFEPPEDVITRRDEILARDQELVEGANTIFGRASPGNALAGQLIGGVGAEFLDPIALLSLPAGAPARAGLLATMAIEGGINAFLGAAETGARNQIAAELGQEETSVLMNATIGGIFGAGASALLRGVEVGTPAAFNRLGRMFPRPQERRALAETAMATGDAEVQALAQQVLRDVEDAEAAGADESRDAHMEHEERAQEGAVALEEGRAPEMPDRPVTAAGRPSIIGGQIVELDPREIQREPGVFQFRTDADEEGVVDTLRDVQQWDPQLAGTITAYEYEDGRISVADGHQRTALANRILAANPNANIAIPAYVYRQADGYTPEQVMVIATVANIVQNPQGMTRRMAIDAARVLRVDPSQLSNLPRGPGINMVQGLRSLSEDAFSLVINDVVQARFGALVGRLVEDPRLHEQMIRLLERTSPSTEAQAEAIVRQGLMAPVREGTTSDLFGEQDVAQSLYIERAKVLESTMRMLRQDEATFRVLNDRGDTITAAGNQLDKASNAEQREIMQRMLQQVDRLAYRAGPISEAINNGAQAYAGNGRLADAARGVLEAVRSELGRSGLDGSGGGNSVGAAEPQGSSAATPDPNEGFDNPLEGRGVEEQIANTRIDRPDLESQPEGFSSDEEGRRDLGRRVSAGASREELDNHPAVVKAVADMQERAQNATDLSEIYDTAEWHASREYVFGNEVVTGTDAALPRWIQEAEAFAGPDGPRQERRAMILLGPPAAGKSTIAEELALVRGAAILDSDEIKKTLPEFEGGIGAAAVHEESSQLGDRVEAGLRGSGTNLIFPKVGGSPGSIERAVARFKKDGYTVEIVNMAVTPENAYRRMIGRFVSKGRIIPPSYVDAVGDNPSGTYRTLRDEGTGDGFAEIDNNGGFDDPKPITDRAGEINPFAGSRYDLPAGRGEGVQPEPGGRGADQGTGEPASELTPAGTQMLMDGVAPVTARERVQAAADKPMTGPTRTSDTVIGGMFDANDPARFDLFDQVPVGVRQVEGETVAETMTRADLAAELDADDEFADQIGFCLR